MKYLAKVRREEIEDSGEMDNYQIVLAKKARKDIGLLTEKQKTRLKQILQQVLAINPYMGKPLKGRLSGLYSYRLNLKDRILYEIKETDRVVFIIRARSHYGE